ncbi:hypothetical protein Val02_70080 [Virgisporangium aliadipatigenens]|uniref:Uncharacterized protein n=1 Tax=Virgisporangium aliadipatigenens TaxID=741659 RepID=A0A8J3YTE0_9ACTN|nr:hypothetical protein [Virgisporangium aliadipatigenens]GIJ50122.1 hypothetical protein Val02_70080 [Virgisporangium aliadipatigenens]
MADQPSPWSSADTVIEVAPVPSPVEATPVVTPQRTASTGPARAGAVTRPVDLPPPPPPDVLAFGADDDPVKRNKLLMRWFGGAAALVVLIGVIATLAMVLGSGGTAVPDLFGDKADAPPDTRPDLVKNCPVPSAYPEPQAAPPPEPGPRTVDGDSGVSYKAFGEPWIPWDTTWTGGTLKVDYSVGQHFVTEVYSGGTYHASILSASVPATNNDALVVDLKCTGRQIAADVRQQYYPNPNRLEQIDERETRLGGRPAWVSIFRLHFNRQGLSAKSELVGLALIDVGRPNAAIVYVSIPDTHRQFDGVVNEVFDSVRAV